MSCQCNEQMTQNLISKVPNNQSIFFSGVDDSCKCNIGAYNYWTEIIVNGSVTVPDVKPPILEIDSVNVKLQIISQKVVKTPALMDFDEGKAIPVGNLENKITTGRKLIIEGLACLSISYLSKTCDESLHTFHGFIPFSAYIVLPQYPEPCVNLDALNMSYNIVSCIESILVKEHTDRSVMLCIPFVLQAIPTGTESAECQYGLNPINPYDCTFAPADNEPCIKNNDPIFKGICSENKIESILKDPCDNLWVEMDVPETLTLPMCKPSIDQILSVTSKVDIMCLKVVSTPVVCAPSYEGLVLTGRKLVVEAILRQRITYTARQEEECQSIHSAHFDVPISTFIILPEFINLGDKFVVTPCIENIFICTLDDRTIFKNTTIFMKATQIRCGNCC
ncbi:MAG: SPOCS domain-containing protein [Clostridium sp.]